MDKTEYSNEELTLIVAEQQRIIELLKERIIEIAEKIDNDHEIKFTLFSKFWDW